MNLTDESIRDIAVQAVTEFVNNRMSLTDSLVKQATLLDLNTDQIKRAVEATNQIAYLKLLKTAQDRTFEFPLAEADEVIQGVISPSIEKAASVQELPRDPFEVFLGIGDGIEKVASSTPVVTEEQAFWNHSLLAQSFSKVQSELEKRAEDDDVFLLNLAERIHKFNRDPLCIEKMAEACNYDVSLFRPISRLCGFELEKKASTTTGRDKVFIGSDLAEAEELISMYKEANERIAHRKNLEDSLEKISGILGTIGSKIGKMTGNLANKMGQGLGYKKFAPPLAAAGAAAGLAGSAWDNRGKILPMVGNRVNDVFTATSMAPRTSVWDKIHGN